MAETYTTGDMERMLSAPPPTQPSPGAKKSYSTEELFGKAASAAVQTPSGTSKFFSDAAAPFTGFKDQLFKNIDDMKESFAQAGKDLKDAWNDDSEAPGAKLPGVSAAKGIGEGLLALGEAVWVYPETLVDQFASKPTNIIVSNVAGMASKYAADDQSRPAGWDKAVRQGRPTPTDWTITKRDVDLTAQSTEHFLNDAYQTLGGLKFHAAHNIITDARQASQWLTERKAYAAQAIDNSFSQLAAVAPDEAEALTEKINEVHPQLAAKMQKRMAKWATASPEELQQLGEQHAQTMLAIRENAFNMTDHGTVQTGEFKPFKEPPEIPPTGYEYRAADIGDQVKTWNSPKRQKVKDGVRVPEERLVKTWDSPRRPPEKPEEASDAEMAKADAQLDEAVKKSKAKKPSEPKPSEPKPSEPKAAEPKEPKSKKTLTLKKPTFLQQMAEASISDTMEKSVTSKMDTKPGGGCF